jgi:heat-inducible transcriptional repressor
MTLNEPVLQEQLSAIADRVTQILQGKDAIYIQSIRTQFNGLEQEVVDWVLEDALRSNALLSGEVYMDGLANVLAEPEFTGSDEARRALRMLEERSMLQELLSRAMPSNSVGGVHVLIGGEGTWTDLRQCSIVLARYGTPGLATGTLGVLGPMRMSYGRTISTVRFIANLLSDMVSESMVE